MNVKFITAGFCLHPEFMVKKGGSFKTKKFPATVALIKHPVHGYILYDTGYSLEFYQATQHFPEKLYALITPVDIKKEETIVFQLQQIGIAAEDVKHIILSHFHADHIAGCKDFPSAQFYFLNDAYKNIRHLNRFSALKAGFLKTLLPNDFSRRAHTSESGDFKKIPQQLAPFYNGWDIFDDGSIVGISLPGHADGHMGLYINGQDHDYLLVADACWREDQYKLFSPINPLAYLITHNKKQYTHTLSRLHELYKNNKSLKIVACHCSDSHTQIEML